MRLRHERPEDAKAISALTLAAFATARFSDGIEAEIVERLRAAGALTISIVAEQDDEVIGHAAFSPVTIGGESGRWYGLGPVSVRPEQQGRGVGAAMVRHGLDELRALGAAGCVVLGDPNYYLRFGFTHDPRLTYGDHGEHFQRVILSGAAPDGVVQYHPAFGENG